MAVPVFHLKLDALCIAPFGMEEGTEVHLTDAFGLYVGEPVSFRFFGTSERQDDPVGAVVDPAALTEVAPIETTLDGDEGSVVHVRLRARKRSRNVGAFSGRCGLGASLETKLRCSNGVVSMSEPNFVVGSI